MLQTVVRRFDPAGLGLAIAVILATWGEPYAAPGTATVETRLDVIIGLGLPLILILVAADSLWQRWRNSARPPRERGIIDAESPMDDRNG